MKYLLGLLLCVFGLNARAIDLTQDPLMWTTEALLLADYAQTRQGMERPDKYHELNPMLGAHPSTDKVNAYFATWAASVYFSDKLFQDKRNRTLFLIAVSSVEATVIAHNLRLGLQVRF